VVPDQIQNDAKEAPPPLPPMPEFVRRRRRDRRPEPRDNSIVESTDVSLMMPTAEDAIPREPSDVAEQARDLMDRMRRDESVIAEAAMFQRKPHQRAAAAMERMGTSIRVAITETGPELIRRLRHPARRSRRDGAWTHALLGRFDRRDAKHRPIIVAIPYGIAAALAVLALVLHGGSSADDSIAPVELAAAAPETSAAPTPEPAAAASETARVDVEEIPSLAEAAPAASAAVAPRDPFAGVRRTVPIRSSLRVAPDVMATRASRLAAGTEMITYPSFPAPAGWILARRADGAIGFMAAANLEGRRDAKLIAELKKRKRARRRRARDW